MIRVLRFAAATLSCLAAIAAPALAAPPVQCGDTLYAPVTLTADVICGPGTNGLIIGADKVRIDLNGFAIEGPYTYAAPTAPAAGVFSSGYWGVEVVGPGRIAGFLQPIDIAGGGNHRVSGVVVTGESGHGVRMRNASGSWIENSRLPEVIVFADRRSRATANRIVGNEVGPYPGLPGGGIVLHGCNTADNVVAGNSIVLDPATVVFYAHAVSLLLGAHGNQVLDNKIAMGDVYLEGSSNNLIANNYFWNHGGGYEGIDLEASNGAVLCSGVAAVLPSSKNIVRDNEVHGGNFGVLIDSTNPPAVSSGNVVTRNRFVDQAYSGLIFGSGAASNDARGNTYVNVPLVAYDFGVGNLWP